MTKIELYNTAKQTYYNGNPIMTDIEFDELEKELDLENKSYIGTHNPSYTIHHPFIMGSLSKVQVHEVNGKIDYNSYIKDIYKYVNQQNDPTSRLIITPKYDGCSFEAIYEFGKIVSISTRGDGNYGKDIYSHIHNLLEKAVESLRGNHIISLRGEVLINKDIFKKKYSEFVNPRSFVAGILNNKSENVSQDQLDDLSIVIYDTRIMDEMGVYQDNDWTLFQLDNFGHVKNSHIGYISKEFLPQHYKCVYTDKFDFEEIYKEFENYRNNDCKFALDGFVIKPTKNYRKNNLTEYRPTDCVAIKFVPIIQETEVIDIEWNLSKNNEYIPVVITKPVVMDGKTINRASGSNYGNLISKKISIGTKIVLSLAGDIIPFIYKISDDINFNVNNLCLPKNSYINGIHLMANLNDNEIKKNKFINSGITLNIPNLGPAELTNIWNYINSNINSEFDDFFGEYTYKELPQNILELSSYDIYQGIIFGTKNGATGKANKIKKEFGNILAHLTLTDIIRSCNFKLCGSKVSDQCANYLLNKSNDFSHLAFEGYSWVYDKNSDNYKIIIYILNKLGRTFDDFKITEVTNKSSNQIPVILTGEPNNYKTKSEFLSCHPEYRQTTQWKEVQIVFTNSLDSNTVKMKKAREKNIEIRLY